MILAAGLGKRLRPLTYFRAKAAVPLLNRPLLSYSLELFRRVGIKSVMVNLHHLPDSVRAAAKNAPEEVEFSMEREILGTAGCLRKVSSFLSQGTSIISNGKIYFEEDLKSALAFHKSSGSMVTMVLVPYGRGDPYAPVVMDSRQRIVGFTRVSGVSGTPRDTELDSRRSGVETRESHYIYTGVQIIEPSLLDFIPPGPSDTVNDIYPRLIREGYPIHGFVSGAYWSECSTPSRYLTASLEIFSRRAMSRLSPNTLPTSYTQVICGESVHIPTSTSLRNCVLWNDIELGRHSSFSNVMITDSVRNLPANLHLRDAILTPFREELIDPSGLVEVGEDYLVWPIS
jgi:NDP-sugar pyrophosphorylase family protein